MTLHDFHEAYVGLVRTSCASGDCYLAPGEFWHNHLVTNLAWALRGFAGVAP